MKTTQRLKEEVYKEVQNSGLLKTVQAQLKSHVYDLIEQKNSGNGDKISFQYEHPLLQKLTNYPGTALCMDLIQQFLQSFKFKHTLNVFRKEVNRGGNINRSTLSKQCKMETQSQSVLLTLVQQAIGGTFPTLPVRKNNFIKEQNQQKEINITLITTNKSQENQNKTDAAKKKENVSTSDSKQDNNKKQSDKKQIIDKKEQENKLKSQNSIGKQKQKSKQQNIINEAEIRKQASENELKQKQVAAKKKKPQPPPQAATDLLSDVMSKCAKIVPQNKQKQKKQLFESKKAFSQQKQKKVLDPSQSGKNKIRGVSASKPSAFMNKFLPQAAVKNESLIDQELDQFQQSKDSTRKNPLFSSNESGFDKSGFDRSVDSNAIGEYQYSQKAKKFTKNR